MNNMYDFSNIYEKINIIKKNIINDLFIQKDKFNEFSDLSIKDFEIIFLWQTYIAVSSFCIKLEKVCGSKDLKIKGNSEHFFELFQNTSQIMTKNYFDEEYNDSIINLLKIIVYTNENPNYSFFHKESNSSFINIFRNFYRGLKNRNLKNKSFVFDNNKWLALTFNNNKNNLLPMNYIFKNINHNLRDKISKEVNLIFSKNIKNLFLINDKKINQRISKLFSNYYNSFLSLSLLEGFNKNQVYYNKFLKNSKIKFVHTCNGFLTSDYLKIFSVFARKKGCLLITHEHGVYNFFNIKNFYKIHTTLQISDYYLPWGHPKLKSSYYYEVEKIFNVKILNSGSVYLHDIKSKFTQNKVTKKNTILYIDSPFKKHNIFELDGDFDNILSRKNKICDLFLKLINFNPEIKIIFKPFPFSHYQNPIFNLSNKLDPKNFEITNSNTINLIHNSDLVLLDSLSTSFAECITMKKPVLLFGNKFEYVNTSNKGKLINDNLSIKKIILYQTEDIFNAINQFFSNSDQYKLNSSVNFDEFKKSMATPVSMVNFHKNISDLI